MTPRRCVQTAPIGLVASFIRGLGFAVVLALFSAAPSARGADVDVATKDWQTACRLEFCAVVQQYPPIVTHIYDREVERSAVTFAVPRDFLNGAIIGLSLPFDVDRAKGVTVAYQAGDIRTVPINDCNQDGCYALLLRGILSTVKDPGQVSLINKFMNGELLAYTFIQNGSTFKVTANLSGFMAHYNDIQAYLKSSK